MPSTFRSIPTPILPTPSPASPWAIPDLLPSQSLNYVVGGLRCGKTNFSLNLLNEYIEGRGFLGYGLDLDMDEAGTPTSTVGPPLSTGAIVCGGDRTRFRAAVRGFSSLRDPENFPITFTRPDPTESGGVDVDATTLAEAYDELTVIAHGHSIRFLFLENLQNLMSSGKLLDLRAVSVFCRMIHAFCEERNVTVIATVPCTKQRRGEYYSNLGDRVYGTIAWAQAASTLFVIEDFDGEARTEKKTSLKRLFVEPRHAFRKILYADYDSAGILRLAAGLSAPGAVRENSYTRLDDRLAVEPAGREFTKEDVKDWEVRFSGEKVTLRAIERWLKKRATEGVLEKTGSGRATSYKKL